MLQPSYEIFLDTAIRAISLRELVGAVRPVESLRVSRGFQERLHAWATDHLAAWQRPRELHPWSEPLPRNALGKLLRSEVREQVGRAR